MTGSTFPSVAHGRTDWRPPPARAGEPVTDDPRDFDPQRGVVLAQADGDDAQMMCHEPETTPVTVAALYVDPKGVYANLPGVEVWDEARDARLYDGPWPVVAHPPCARWSRTAALTEAWFGYKRGDDHGCFEAALKAVRRFGGVLEHPAYSAAWSAFDLPRPIYYTGWTVSLFDPGATCYVEQGRYGLASKKPTWLYAVGCELPELRWGFTPDSDGDSPRDPGGGGMHAFRDRHSKGYEASRTPESFRDILVTMASRP